MTTTAASHLATLGGGCYWCLEAVFQNLRGVERVESGFAGGHILVPTRRFGTPVGEARFRGPSALASGKTSAP